MTRRWIRFELPVMVCVDIDDHIEQERVTTVVLGVEHDDITLARGADGNYLIYDADAHRLSYDDPDAHTAVSLAADRSDWPARDAWQEGPDALRDPWLYDEGRHRRRRPGRRRPEPLHDESTSDETPDRPN